MYSILIPTLWREREILERNIRGFEADPRVTDVIILDNSGFIKPDDLYDDGKLTILPGKHTNYVNRSWNLLVKSCPSQFFILMNDDIIIDAAEYLDALDTINLHNHGAVGIHFSSINEGCVTPAPFDVDETGWGWGTCIAGAVKNWVPIPEQIRIWYGDNWLQLTMGTPLSIRGLKWFGKMESTSGDPAFDQIKMLDQRRWNKMVKDNSIPFHPAVR